MKSPTFSLLFSRWHTITHIPWFRIGVVCALFSDSPLRASRASLASGKIQTWELLEELNKMVPRTSSQILIEDSSYGIARHDWVLKQLERYVSKNWHRRDYVPDINDCDDFADDLRYFLRKSWRDTASPGTGAAPVAMSKYVWVDPEKGIYAHAVVLIRTELGWFIADPTKGWNPVTQRMDLIPFRELKGMTSRVVF